MEDDLMRRIDSYEDQMRGVITIELPSGRRVAVDEEAYREIGMAGVAHLMGEAATDARLSVYQGDSLVGTLPALFDPAFVVSRSCFYDARRGDFLRSERGWEAHRSLGKGDLSATPGFQWADDPRKADRDVEADRELAMQALKSLSAKRPTSPAPGLDRKHLDR
jgi:hypothetical protein